MTKFKEKKGFSLAESIISMVLLALVILLTMTTLTRKKSVPLNKVTISGIYACWQEENDLKNRYFDGHRQVYNDLKDGKCHFEMDRRAYKYYIFAAGANNDCELEGGEQQCIEGQVTQRYIEAPSGANEKEMELDFTIGNQTNGDTKVMQNGNNILEALGNITTGVTYRNLKRCKFIDKNPCKAGENPVCNVDVNGKSINITCMKGNLAIQDDSCQMQTYNEYDPRNHTNSYFPDKNYFIGYCVRNKINEDDAESVNATKDVKVNLERIDSSIKNEHVELKKAKIVKVLRMLPESVQNGLTDELLKYYQDPSKPKKNGIVLIIW